MFGNLKELPKPVGTYTVGITHMDFIDQARKQVFPFEETKAYREIPVTIFYPSDSTEGKNTAPYAFPEALEVIHKLTHGFWSKNMAKLKTRVYENISVSKKQDKFPIIFFNHGYFAYEMQSTILCSDLASLGYIVISVGHPYESSGIKYRDGRIVKAHKSNIKRFNSSTNKEYKKIIFKELVNRKKWCSDEKSMELATALFGKIGFELSRSTKIWAADTIFIADQLEDINNGKIDTIFKDKLQLDPGFGITGHSVGAATSAQVCYDDRRFICGINIDGGTWGDYMLKDINTPFMVLASKIIRNLCRTTFIYNSKDSYLVLIDKTAHWGFCDVCFASRQAILNGNMIGFREKYEFRKIITDFHAAFFSKYLLDNRDINLKELNFTGIKYIEKLKSIDERMEKVTK
ncbi:hypothetical protein [Brassicibacter mesophilus]|uniref:alpha/beta hydrolase n=1 Tax=Brassicibacter mesophilus TaxID=745119 RepID=UPI003D254773